MRPPPAAPSRTSVDWIKQVTMLPLLPSCLSQMRASVRVSKKQSPRPSSLCPRYLRVPKVRHVNFVADQPKASSGEPIANSGGAASSDPEQDFRIQEARRRQVVDPAIPQLRRLGQSCRNKVKTAWCQRRSVSREEVIGAWSEPEQVRSHASETIVRRRPDVAYGCVALFKLLLLRSMIERDANDQDRLRQIKL